MTLKDLIVAAQGAATTDTKAAADFAAASAAKDAASAAKAAADTALNAANGALSAAMKPNVVYDLGGGQYVELIDGAVTFGAVVDPSTITVPDPNPAPAPAH
jgi:hypothetical protein